MKRQHVSFGFSQALLEALLLVLALFSIRANAFSLLGPYADWMEVTNEFRLPGDIGGPMDITEGYRWNVPVVTYGFDQSFLDYFGSNGVAAVESAMAVLNNLPPASAVVLTNFPDFSQRNNYAAAAQNLYDLKSETLSVLLEQMGLAQPTRYVLSVKKWDPSLEPYVYRDAGLDGASEVIPEYVVERNFDPVTLSQTIYINGTIYSGYIYYGVKDANGVPAFETAVEFPIDPWDQSFDAVADNFLLTESQSFLNSPFGMFYSGLTYDDVGGLKFLLSTNNLKVETLLSDVRAATTNPAIVQTALRPGVDKISFVRQPLDSITGLFQPFTNRFTDTYVSNGQVLQQELDRTISRPDILFSADDNGKQSQHTIAVLRTGIANWVNNWELNGDTNHLGPGVIAPPINVVFQKLGSYIGTQEPNPQQNAFSSASSWGWFDETTNTPVVFPNFNSGEARPLTVRLRLFPTRPRADSFIYDPSLSYAWRLPVPIDATVQLQTSTNLSSWLPVMTVTNSGGIVEWFHSGTSQANRFFRVVPGASQN